MITDSSIKRRVAKINNSMDNDDQIILSVKNGHIQDYEIIINRYKKKLVNFVNRMIFDYDEAENISQEVFIRVYEKISYYKSEGNFQAFIYKIAKNITLNYIKRKKRLFFFSEFPIKGQEDLFFKKDAEQDLLVEEKEKNVLVLNALAKLNENQRIALISKVYLEFSYKQIADITGWSEPKIETLISRGRVALKKIITMQENKTRSV